jgi:hypothetical protein
MITNDNPLNKDVLNKEVIPLFDPIDWQIHIESYKEILEKNQQKINIDDPNFEPFKESIKLHLVEMFKSQQNRLTTTKPEEEDIQLKKFNETLPTLVKEKFEELRSLYSNGLGKLTQKQDANKFITDVIDRDENIKMACMQSLSDIYESYMQEVFMTKLIEIVGNGNLEVGQNFIQTNPKIFEQFHKFTGGNIEKITDKTSYIGLLQDFFILYIKGSGALYLLFTENEHKQFVNDAFQKKDLISLSESPCVPISGEPISGEPIYKVNDIVNIVNDENETKPVQIQEIIGDNYFGVYEDRTNVEFFKNQIVDKLGKLKETFDKLNLGNSDWDLNLCINPGFYELEDKSIFKNIYNFLLEWNRNQMYECREKYFLQNPTIMTSISDFFKQVNYDYLIKKDESIRSKDDESIISDDGSIMGDDDAILNNLGKMITIDQTDIGIAFKERKELDSTIFRCVSAEDADRLITTTGTNITEEQKKNIKTRIGKAYRLPWIGSDPMNEVEKLELDEIIEQNDNNYTKVFTFVKELFSETSSTSIKFAHNNVSERQTNEPRSIYIQYNDSIDAFGLLRMSLLGMNTINNKTNGATAGAGELLDISYIKEYNEMVSDWTHRDLLINSERIPLLDYWDIIMDLNVTIRDNILEGKTKKIGKRIDRLTFLQSLLCCKENIQENIDALLRYYANHNLVSDLDKDILIFSKDNDRRVKKFVLLLQKLQETDDKYIHYPYHENIEDYIKKTLRKKNPKSSATEKVDEKIEDFLSKKIEEVKKIYNNKEIMQIRKTLKENQRTNLKEDHVLNLISKLHGFCKKQIEPNIKDNDEKINVDIPNDEKINVDIPNDEKIKMDDEKIKMDDEKIKFNNPNDILKKYLIYLNRYKSGINNLIDQIFLNNDNTFNKQNFNTLIEMIVTGLDLVTGNFCGFMRVKDGNAAYSQREYFQIIPDPKSGSFLTSLVLDYYINIYNQLSLLLAKIQINNNLGKNITVDPNLSLFDDIFKNIATDAIIVEQCIASISESTKKENFVFFPKIRYAYFVNKDINLLREMFDSVRSNEDFEVFIKDPQISILLSEGQSEMIPRKLPFFEYFLYQVTESKIMASSSDFQTKLFYVVNDYEDANKYSLFYEYCNNLNGRSLKSFIPIFDTYVANEHLSTQLSTVHINKDDFYRQMQQTFMKHFNRFPDENVKREITEMLDEIFKLLKESSAKNLKEFEEMMAKFSLLKEDVEDLADSFNELDLDAQEKVQEVQKEPEVQKVQEVQVPLSNKMEIEVFDGGHNFNMDIENIQELKNTEMQLKTYLGQKSDLIPFSNLIREADGGSVLDFLRYDAYPNILLNSVEPGSIMEILSDGKLNYYVLVHKPLTIDELIEYYNIGTQFETKENIDLNEESLLTAAIMLQSNITLNAEIILPETTLTAAIMLPETTLTAAIMIPETTLTAETTINGNIMLPETTLTGDIMLPDTTISYAGTQLPAGTVLPTGTKFAAETVLPTGTKFSAGTVFPAGTVFAAGTVVAAGMVLPIGTQLETGTMLPAGTQLPAGTLPAGTIISGKQLSKEEATKIYQLLPDLNMYHFVELAGTATALTPDSVEVIMSKYFKYRDDDSKQMIFDENGNLILNEEGKQIFDQDEGEMPTTKLEKITELRNEFIKNVVERINDSTVKSNTYDLQFVYDPNYLQQTSGGQYVYIGPSIGFAGKSDFTALIKSINHFFNNPIGMHEYYLVLKDRSNNENFAKNVINGIDRLKMFYYLYSQYLTDNYGKPLYEHPFIERTPDNPTLITSECELGIFYNNIDNIPQIEDKDSAKKFAYDFVSMRIELFKQILEHMKHYAVLEDSIFMNRAEKIDTAYNNYIFNMHKYYGEYRSILVEGFGTILNNLSQENNPFLLENANKKLISDLASFDKFKNEQLEYKLCSLMKEDIEFISNGLMPYIRSVVAKLQTITDDTFFEFEESGRMKKIFKPDIYITSRETLENTYKLVKNDICSDYCVESGRRMQRWKWFEELLSLFVSKVFSDPKPKLFLERWESLAEQERKNVLENFHPPYRYISILGRSVNRTQYPIADANKSYINAKNDFTDMYAYINAWKDTKYRFLKKYQEEFDDLRMQARNTLCKQLNSVWPKKQTKEEFEYFFKEEFEKIFEISNAFSNRSNQLKIENQNAIVENQRKEEEKEKEKENDLLARQINEFLEYFKNYLIDTCKVLGNNFIRILDHYKEKQKQEELQLNSRIIVEDFVNKLIWREIPGFNKKVKENTFRLLKEIFNLKYYESGYRYESESESKELKAKIMEVMDENYITRIDIGFYEAVKNLGTQYVANAFYDWIYNHPNPKKADLFSTFINLKHGFYKEEKKGTMFTSYQLFLADKIMVKYEVDSFIDEYEFSNRKISVLYSEPVEQGIMPTFNVTNLFYMNGNGQLIYHNVPPKYDHIIQFNVFIKKYFDYLSNLVYGAVFDLTTEHTSETVEILHNDNTNELNKKVENNEYDTYQSPPAEELEDGIKRVVVGIQKDPRQKIIGGIIEGKDGVKTIFKNYVEFTSSKKCLNTGDYSIEQGSVTIIIPQGSNFAKLFNEGTKLFYKSKESENYLIIDQLKLPLIIKIVYYHDGILATKFFTNQSDKLVEKYIFNECEFKRGGSRTRSKKTKRKGTRSKKNAFIPATASNPASKSKPASKPASKPVQRGGFTSETGINLSSYDFIGNILLKIVKSRFHMEYAALKNVSTIESKIRSFNIPYGLVCTSESNIKNISSFTLSQPNIEKFSPVYILALKPSAQASSSQSFTSYMTSAIENENIYLNEDVNTANQQLMKTFFHSFYNKLLTDIQNRCTNAKIGDAKSNIEVSFDPVTLLQNMNTRNRLPVFPVEITITGKGNYFKELMTCCITEYKTNIELVKQMLLNNDDCNVALYNYIIFMVNANAVVNDENNFLNANSILYKGRFYRQYGENLNYTSFDIHYETGDKSLKLKFMVKNQKEEHRIGTIIISTSSENLYKYSIANEDLQINSIGSNIEYNSKYLFIKSNQVSSDKTIHTETIKNLQNGITHLNPNVILDTLGKFDKYITNFKNDHPDDYPALQKELFKIARDIEPLQIDIYDDEIYFFAQKLLKEHLDGADTNPFFKPIDNNGIIEKMDSVAQKLLDTPFFIQNLETLYISSYNPKFEEFKYATQKDKKLDLTNFPDLVLECMNAKFKKIYELHRDKNNVPDNQLNKMRAINESMLKIPYLSGIKEYSNFDVDSNVVVFNDVLVKNSTSNFQYNPEYNNALIITSGSNNFQKYGTNVIFENESVGHSDYVTVCNIYEIMTRNSVDVEQTYGIKTSSSNDSVITYSSDLNLGLNDIGIGNYAVELLHDDTVDKRRIYIDNYEDDYESDDDYFVDDHLYNAAFNEDEESSNLGEEYFNEEEDEESYYIDDDEESSNMGQESSNMGQESSNMGQESFNNNAWSNKYTSSSKKNAWPSNIASSSDNNSSSSSNNNYNVQSKFKMYDEVYGTQNGEETYQGYIDGINQDGTYNVLIPASDKMDSTETIINNIPESELTIVTSGGKRSDHKRSDHKQKEPRRKPTRRNRVQKNKVTRRK